MATKLFVLSITIIFISACQTTQPTRFKVPEASTVINSHFKHLAVFQEGEGPRLHVYIEGDGRPFVNRFLIAADPSPQTPLALSLMMLDKTSSLYLGRPCYFANSRSDMADSACKLEFWTSARYSEKVVESMISGLRHHLATRSYQGISLIGHSGGGSLAVLMAARMPEVDQVVTLAGNLDIAAWANLHHYTPLKHSLNPSDLNLTHTKQLHFGGDRDKNVPPSLGAAWLNSMGQTMHIIKDADHNCCWLTHWNQILTQINQQMTP